MRPTTRALTFIAVAALLGLATIGVPKWITGDQTVFQSCQQTNTCP